MHKLLSVLLGVGCVSGCASSNGGFQAATVLSSIDNDLVGNSDGQYTSGLTLSYFPEHQSKFADTVLPESIGKALDANWPIESDDQRFVVYSLSHRIFTPSDLAAHDVVEDDLPYSALLYATATVGSEGVDSLSAGSLSLGFVGPLALGEQLQSGVHALFGSDDPKGWDNQLDNEPLINIGIEHRHRLYRIESQSGLGTDMLGALTASVGNLQSQATAAVTVRAGFRLPTNFQMLSSFLADESVGLRPHDPRVESRTIYVYAGFAATLLGNAIYLDGNTFSDSHSVDHEHQVVRGALGVAGEYGSLMLSLALERTTLPWDQPDGRDSESYLRIAVSWNF